ncbi:MAG: transporter related protein [Proteobacteria bacterium]|nr:transporter related protein [Pseudomonadota bacterium]
MIDGQVTASRFKAIGFDVAVPGSDGAATLSLRPERIVLSLGGQAKIRAASYLGSRMEYISDISGREQLVSRPITDHRYNLGDAVDISIDRTAAIRVASSLRWRTLAPCGFVGVVQALRRLPDSRRYRSATAMIAPMARTFQFAKLSPNNVKVSRSQGIVPCWLSDRMISSVEN